MKYSIIILLLIYAGCSNNDQLTDIYSKGQREYAVKNLSEAEKLFSEVISIDSEYFNAYLMRAKIYYHNKDYDNAIRDLNSILAKDSDFCGALYWKGRTLVMSGRDQESETLNLLQKVLEIDSHHIPARLLLALVYEKNGKYKEALHEYLYAMNEEESLISARGNMAVLYMRLGLNERAAMELDRAIKISEITGRDIKSLKLIKSEFEKWGK